MEQRPLGSTDLRVSVLGFGCAPIGSRAGSAESRRALMLALDQGITFFDTADMYGVGGSETTLARVLGPQRDKVVIATKCGYTFSNRLKAVAWVKPLLRPLVKKLKGVKASAAAVMASQRSQNFDPAYIESCVHGSLQRLATDRIDLFFLHDPSMEVIRRGEALRKLADLKKAGKLRHYGVSCDADVAAAALADAGSGVSAVEVNANVLEPEALSLVLPLARERGAGFIARQPFAHGKLLETPAAAGAMRSRGLPSGAADVCSLAIRWLKETPGVSSILPSMMKPEHLRANVAAASAGPLSDAEREAARAMGGGGGGG